MLQVAQNVEGIRTILERLLARPAARAPGAEASPVNLVNNLVSLLWHQQGEASASCTLNMRRSYMLSGMLRPRGLPRAVQDWYGSMNLMTFLRETGRFARVGTMLAKDSVRTRLESPQGISFTEFCYQLL